MLMHHAQIQRTSTAAAAGHARSKDPARRQGGRNGDSQSGSRTPHSPAHGHSAQGHPLTSDVMPVASGPSGATQVAVHLAAEARSASQFLGNVRPPVCSPKGLQLAKSGPGFRAESLARCSPLPNGPAVLERSEPFLNVHGTVEEARPLCA